MRKCRICDKSIYSEEHLICSEHNIATLNVKDIARKIVVIQEKYGNWNCDVFQDKETGRILIDVSLNCPDHYQAKIAHIFNPRTTDKMLNDLNKQIGELTKQINEHDVNVRALKAELNKLQDEKEEAEKLKKNN